MKTHHYLIPHEGHRGGQIRWIAHMRPRVTGHLWWRRYIEQAQAVAHLLVKPEVGDELVYCRASDGAQRHATIYKFEDFSPDLKDVYLLTLDWP